jgi:hypothetical protein
MRKIKKTGTRSANKRAPRKVTNILKHKKRSDEFPTMLDKAAAEFNDDVFYEDYETITDLDQDSGYHQEFDDDYNATDDKKAGRQGEHTTRTGSTNNSRFGGNQQYKK